MQDEICSGNTYKAYKYCSVVAVGRRTHKPMIEIKIAQPGASITRCVAELAGGYSLQKAKTLASFFCKCEQKSASYDIIFSAKLCLTKI